MKKCINNDKCENFLELGSLYDVKQSEDRKECYSVLVTDKKKRIKDGWFDFNKTRFE